MNRLDFGLVSSRKKVPETERATPPSLERRTTSVEHRGQVDSRVLDVAHSLYQRLTGGGTRETGRIVA